MAADALPAFELLLRLMYGAVLPEAAAADAMLLVRTYTAADMYGVQPHCADVLAAGLCRMAEGAAANSFDLDLLLALYGLPEGRAHLAPLLAGCQPRVAELLLGDDVQQSEALATALCRRRTEDLTLDLVGRLMGPDLDHEDGAADGAAARAAAAPHMAPLRAKCMQRVMQLFDDVPATITSKELQQQFCALPFSVVLAWLKEDDLNVHSENCVVLLLSMWCRSQRINASREQMSELACHVRALHVSQLYLQEILPNLDWFSAHWYHLQAITAAKLSGAKLSPDPANWDNLPPAWSADPRKRTGMFNLSLDWEISVIRVIKQLSPSYMEEDEDAVLTSSKQLYINGAFCTLMTDAKKTTGDKFTMGLYLKACREHPLLKFPCNHVLSAKLWCKLGQVQDWTIKQVDKTVTKTGYVGAENMLHGSLSSLNTTGFGQTEKTFIFVRATDIILE